MAASMVQWLSNIIASNQEDYSGGSILGTVPWDFFFFKTAGLQIAVWTQSREDNSIGRLFDKSRSDPVTKTKVTR